MFIQSGIQNLNKQYSSSERKDKQASDKEFSDILKNTDDKKSERNKQTSSAVPSKKDKHKKYIYGDGESAPVKQEQYYKKNEQHDDKKVESQVVQNVKRDESQVSQNNNSQSEKVETNANTLSENDALLSNIQNLTDENVETNQPLSTYSSVPSKITLEENQKKIQQMENALADMMTQSKESKGLLESTITQNTDSQWQESNLLKQVQPFTNDGQIKIDKDMKLNTELETLQNSGGEENIAKNLIETDGKSDSDQDLSSFEQMLSSNTDIQSSNDSAGSIFSEELNLAQGENRSQKIENMQSIIKQARAVVDDGGGSMEIHLQPEGLGKVHLKVAVNDGQVNVEMMTDNHLAKKALEEGILDIKQALEGHKLLVETVKVEMSPDYQKDFTDLQDHMREQENRNFAEQFLGQFQRERDERLGGMFDSFRNFQRETSEPELRLGNHRNPYTENGKGRSINLVA